MYQSPSFQVWLIPIKSHYGFCCQVYISLVATEGLFPFNQNVWFEFSATSSSEWDSIFQNFLKRGQPCVGIPKFSKIFSQKFSFRIQLCSRNFQSFWLNGSHFGNSTAFEISGNVAGKFLYHLPLFPNFRKFCLNGKRPKFQTVTVFVNTCAGPGPSSDTKLFMS